MSLSIIALAETFYSRRCSRMQTPPGLKWLPAFSSHFSASSPLLLLSINDLLHTYYAAIRRPNLTRQVYTHAAPGPCCPLSLPCIATKEQRGRSSAPDSTVTPTQVQIHFIISWESGEPPAHLTPSRIHLAHDGYRSAITASYRGWSQH